MSALNMRPESDRSRWLPIIVMVVAFAAPATVGFVEIHVARNAQAESAVIDQLQAVAKAEADFHRTNHAYPATLQDLPDLPKPAPYYDYDYQPTSRDSYVLTAAPTQPGKHGRRYFYVDQTGVVRYEVMHPAGPQSAEVPPVPTPQKAGN